MKNTLYQLFGLVIAFVALAVFIGFRGFEGLLEALIILAFMTWCHANVIIQSERATKRFRDDITDAIDLRTFRLLRMRLAAFERRHGWSGQIDEKYFQLSEAIAELLMTPGQTDVLVIWKFSQRLAKRDRQEVRNLIERLHGVMRCDDLSHAEYPWILWQTIAETPAGAHTRASAFGGECVTWYIGCEEHPTNWFRRNIGL